MVNRELVDRLTDVVGAAHVLTDPEVTASYTTDWTGRWHGTTTAVVRPATTDEVADVVRVCARARIPIVPQGGNTGLVGGSVPHHGEVVVSLSRLDQINEVAPVARTLAAGAGVTLARADAAARSHHLALPVDLAARDTATIGGIVATDAGGLRVVRHGSTRAQVAGIEAVLADGTVLRRWTGLAKDNAGYDLPGLLVGSEGTLGIVTNVLMRLVPPPSSTVVTLAAVPSLLDAAGTLDILTSHGGRLEAAEFMLSGALELAMQFGGLRAPVASTAPVYVLAEVSGVETDDVADMLEKATSHVVDAVIEPSPARRLWSYRELLPEAVSALSATAPVKLDVAVPVRQFDTFFARLTSIVSAILPAARPVSFGHLAEGNVHLNVLNVPGDSREHLTDAVLREVARLGGAISAEHGIGVAKSQWLSLTRSAADIAAMRAIKQALDPTGLFNPHAVLGTGR